MLCLAGACTAVGRLQHFIFPVSSVSHTCRLAARLGDYRKDDPESFNLQPQLEYLPQFMFNLRRSQFVQVGQSKPSWHA